MKARPQQTPRRQECCHNRVHETPSWRSAEYLIVEEVIVRFNKSRERMMKADIRESRRAGILWLAYGCLRIAQVAFIVVFSGTLSLMWGAVLERVPNPLVWMTAFHVLLVLAAAWCVISGFFSFVAGFALLRHWPASKVDTLIASLLALPDLPFGIVLGVYTMLALLPRPTLVQERRSQSHIVIPLVPQGSR